MAIKGSLLRLFAEYPDWLPLRFEDSWKGSPDEGDHTHCKNCSSTISIGDICFVKYLEYVSIAICHDCFIDNEEIVSEWIEDGNPDLGERGASAP